MRQISSPFPSNGKTCDADLFLPESAVRPPVIIITHGLGHPRFMATMRYAGHLIESGYAVFLFDYRNYAFSEGDIRNLVDPVSQLDDIRAALVHIRSLDFIDTTRIVLCGISLAGGYALSIAAEDKEITGVICMIPVICPAACFKSKGILYSLPYCLLTWYDRIRAKLGVKPFYLPMIISPDHLKDFQNPDFYPGYAFDCPSVRAKKSVHFVGITNLSTGRSIVWNNLVPFRSMKNILQYEAVTALPEVTCPVLVIAAEQDTIMPFNLLKQKLAGCSSAEVISYTGNHFNVADSRVCDRMMPEIMRFLEKSGLMHAGSAGKTEIHHV